MHKLRVQLLVSVLALGACAPVLAQPASVVTKDRAGVIQKTTTSDLAAAFIESCAKIYNGEAQSITIKAFGGKQGRVHHPQWVGKFRIRPEVVAASLPDSPRNNHRHRPRH